MTSSEKLKGILYIALIPMLLSILTVLAIKFSIVGLYTVIAIYTWGIYLVYLLRANAYTDSEVMDRVIIPNAPPDVVDLLKTKTSRNILINMQLIYILGKKKKPMSQSDLTRYVNKIKRGINYSIPAVEKYLSELETASLISSKKAYTKEYELTPRGDWCYKAIKVCFPKTFFYFIIRHYLGRRTLEAYPQ